MGKRVKLEDPVSELLWTIQKQTEVTLRTYRLQCLLFLIDRHWHIFHSTLKESITSTLMQFLSYDDASIQSWTFLCLAGIAHACAASDGPEPRHLLSSSSSSGPWDAIWTHAMRRSNVPRVCRAACHVAHTLLFHAKTLLSPNKVLNEIETLAKDLNIQGPSFPYDSVCSFLGLCMRVASQDVRLYRMQLEEKVLTWLIDSWRPTKVWDKLTMPPHSVQDVLGLLGAVCGVARQVEVVCEMVLPDCSIVEAMLEEHSTAVIRDFVLYAGLPPFRPGDPFGESSAPSSAVPSLANDFSEGYELASPGGKERRLSAFLVKYLDEFIQEWEADRTLSKLTVERIRVTLDFTITALCFESLLSMNGTRSNRRVVQAACKLICSYLVVVTERRWTWNERLFILASLDPLLLSEPRESDVEPWEMFLPPGQDTGIRQDVLHRLMDGTETGVRRTAKTRREFLQVLFHNSDVSVYCTCRCREVHIFCLNRYKMLFRVFWISCGTHCAWLERALSLSAWNSSIKRRMDSSSESVTKLRTTLIKIPRPPLFCRALYVRASVRWRISPSCNHPATSPREIKTCWNLSVIPATKLSSS